MGREDDLRTVDAELSRLGRIMASTRGHRLRSQTAGTDLAPHELSILSDLDRHGACRLGILADRVHMELPHASRTVRTLADRGLLTHSPDPEDGRAVLVGITPAGRADIESYRQASRDLLSEAVADWSDTRVRDLARALGAITDAFTSHPQLTTRVDG